MTNTQRAAARLSLIFSALVAGVLNGSPLAAPVLILAAYLLCVLVTQGQDFLTAVGPRFRRFASEVLAELARPIGRVR